MQTKEPKGSDREVALGPRRQQPGDERGVFDLAVIGVSAIEEDGTLLDFDYREVRVARAIIENARRVILVADKLKLERSAPIRVGHLRELDYFVTDALPSAALREMCAAHRVDLVEAGLSAHETSDAAE